MSTKGTFTIKQMAALGRGNPGALSVLAELHQKQAVSLVSKIGITGALIWYLYADVCGKKIDRMIEVLNEMEKDANYSCEFRGKKQNVWMYLRRFDYE